MNIQIRQSGSVTILDLNGELTQAGGNTRLLDTTSQQLSSGNKKILLNMQGLRMLNSSGIGTLGVAKQSIRQVGGAIKLLHVEDKVLKVLQLAGMGNAFEIFDDEIDAVRSF